MCHLYFPINKRVASSMREIATRSSDPIHCPGLSSARHPRTLAFTYSFPQGGDCGAPRLCMSLNGSRAVVTRPIRSINRVARPICLRCAPGCISLCQLVAKFSNALRDEAVVVRGLISSDIVAHRQHDLYHIDLRQPEG